VKCEVLDGRSCCPILFRVLPSESKALQVQIVGLCAELSSTGEGYIVIEVNI
jgi:hypothetical protein